MTASEITKLWTALRIYWQRAAPLTDAQAVFLAQGDLGSIDLDVALEVLRRRSSRGDTWQPEVGQIVADARAIASPGTSWPAALALVREAASRHNASDERGAVAYIAERNPTVASWVAEHGWWPIAMAEIDGQTHGPRLQAQLAAAFAAHRPAADNVIPISSARPPRQIGGG